jgi:antitoxin HicB
MNKKKLKEMVDYYVSLKYPIKVSEMEEGGYFIEVIDLPGCMCDANTLDKIPAKVDEAKRDWIEGTLERGGQIPLPEKDELYSGRFLVRTSRTLHRILAKRASQEGTSLNAYVNILLTMNSERYRTATLLSRFMKRMLIKTMKIEVPSKYKYEDLESYGISDDLKEAANTGLIH